MKIFIIIAIILLIAYGGAASYFYFDLITRNRQLAAAMDEAQSLKRKLQEELAVKETMGEKLQKENEKLKKDSLEFLKRQKDTVENRKQLANFLKTQAQQLKDKQRQLQKAEQELGSLKIKNAKLSDIASLSDSIKLERQNDKISKLKNELLNFQGRLKKQEAFLHYNLGVSYTKERKYELAIDEYEKAIGFNPSDPDAHYNLAILYDEYRNNSVRAIEHYKKYLEFKPDADDLDQVKHWIERLIVQEPKLKEIGTVNRLPVTTQFAGEKIEDIFLNKAEKLTQREK